MKIGIFAFTTAGIRLAEQVQKVLPGEFCQLSVPEKYQEYPTAKEQKVFPRQKLFPVVKEWFSSCQALVFIGAAGIAVRAIAPCLVSKASDPAVLCMDEKAQFVIPLAGGHLGGANHLAVRLAKALGGTAVLTTSTDVNRKFAVDSWAAESGLHILNLKAVKEISSRLLEGQPVGFYSDYPVQGSLPEGITQTQTGEAGIYIGQENKTPFSVTLQLVPKNLAVGIGCRKGIAPEKVEQALEKTLADHHLYKEQIVRLASVELKAEEQGLLLLAQKLKVPFITYTAQQLNTLEGEFSSSDFVRSITQVDCVCERSACAEGGELLVKKQALDGVTIAIAQLPYICYFKEEKNGQAD